MTSKTGIHFGRFRLLERLPGAGLGEVFRAEMDEPSGSVRTVVVKRILPDLEAEPAAADAFLDEARQAARLIHPHVVEVHDFGERLSNYFLALDYVDGCDLAALMRFCAQSEQTLPLGASVAIVAAVLEALECAHGLVSPEGTPAGLVHRDVVPANVLLGSDGAIKLAGFGLGGLRDRLAVTVAARTKARQPYLSPEQATGGRVDARSDLFAVGTLAYQMLTGQHPFAAATFEQALHRIVSFDPPRASILDPNVGAELCSVVARALAKSPSDRFQTARELRAAWLVAAARDGIEPDSEKVAALVQGAVAVADSRRALARPS